MSENPSFDTYDKLIELKKKSPEEYKKYMDDLKSVMVDFMFVAIEATALMKEKLERMA